MDSFQPCARQMLTELHVLLQRTPTVFTSTRLVQLMALNMFSVHNLRARGELDAVYVCCVLRLRGARRYHFPIVTIIAVL